jgi:hypothetical protein
MDWRATVEEIKPELSPCKSAIAADKLEHDPRVREAVQKTLEKRGLDEKSKEYFVSKLWEWLDTADPCLEKQQLQAMRILGKAFITETVQVGKPTSLRISGYDEGMRCSDASRRRMTTSVRGRLRIEYCRHRPAMAALPFILVSLVPAANVL